MPTRKQRRRREKLGRHEYEYVVETDEGEEIPLEGAPDRTAKGGKGREGGVVRSRTGREIPKPSMSRVMKRTAIFGPLLFALVWITAPELTTVQKVSQVLFLLIFFIPFSYLVDVLVYRTMVKRQKRQAGQAR